MTRTLPIAALALSVAGCAAARSPVEWTPGKEFTRSDRQEIAELARAVGFAQIARVKANPARPSTGTYRYYEAASALRGSLSVRDVRQQDHLVDTPSVQIENALECASQAKGEPMLRVGCWTTSVGRIGQEERWRIRDGDWHLDVELGRDVGYDVATAIVLAIPASDAG